MSPKQNKIYQNGRQYLVSLLPKEGPALDLCIEKYRALRLEALADGVGSLSGSFEIEQKLPYSHFADLVTQPKRHILVAIELPLDYNSDSNDEEALISGTWVGIGHVLGPIPLSEWNDSAWPNVDSLYSNQEEARWETCWYPYNGYVSPEYRGQGLILKQLVAVLNAFLVDETRRLLASRAKEEGRKTLAIREKIAITPKSRSFVKFYAKLGFREAGNITQEDSLRVKEPGYTYNNEDGTHSQRNVITMERLKHIEASAMDDGETKLQSML